MGVVMRLHPPRTSHRHYGADEQHRAGQSPGQWSRGKAGHARCAIRRRAAAPGSCPARTQPSSTRHAWRPSAARRSSAANTRIRTASSPRSFRTRRRAGSLRSAATDDRAATTRPRRVDRDLAPDPASGRTRPARREPAPCAASNRSARRTASMSSQATMLPSAPASRHPASCVRRDATELVADQQPQLRASASRPRVLARPSAAVMPPHINAQCPLATSPSRSAAPGVSRSFTSVVPAGVQLGRRRAAGALAYPCHRTDRGPRPRKTPTRPRAAIPVTAGSGSAGRSLSHRGLQRNRRAARTSRPEPTRSSDALDVQHDRERAE